MKLTSRLFSVVGLFILGVVCCWGHASPAQEKAKKTDAPAVATGGGPPVAGAALPKWEYKILDVNHINARNVAQNEQEMNQLGETGWELVGTASVVLEGPGPGGPGLGGRGVPTPTGVRLFFKRPKK